MHLRIWRDDCNPVTWLDASLKEGVREILNTLSAVREVRRGMVTLRDKEEGRTRQHRYSRRGEEHQGVGVRVCGDESEQNGEGTLEGSIQDRRHVRNRHDDEHKMISRHIPMVVCRLGYPWGVEAYTGH